MSHNHTIPFYKTTIISQAAERMYTAAADGRWDRISEDSVHFFEDYYASRPFFFTNSCSSALEIAIRSLQIGPGDEVIIPGFSYVALANAVANSGATPVLADVTFPDGNISVQSVESCITPRTRAVIALHYAGSACDIPALTELCRSHGLYFIEDAAQCIGSTFDGKPLGSFGSIGCLSFDYMKNISCGQGGLLVVNDELLLPTVRTIFDNGTNRYALLNGTQQHFEWVGKGVNFQINPIASYFLAGQLRAIREITISRLEKWNAYRDQLSHLVSSGKIILNNPHDCHNGHIFYLVTSSEDERSGLRDYMRLAGIFCEHHYSSLAHSIYGRQVLSPAGSLDNAEKLCKQVLRLPLWHDLTLTEISIVTDRIGSFYNH